MCAVMQAKQVRLQASQVMPLHCQTTTNNWQSQADSAALYLDQMAWKDAYGQAG